MDTIISSLNGILWAPPIVYLILAFGLLFSILTKFCQIRLFKEMFKLIKESDASKAGVSPFQALWISVGSRVGTGNIAGVITAIALGGPGAVFWMWVVAFIGAASAFIESTLSQIYKVKHAGQYRGGPAFYIEKGIGSKWFARLFAVAAIIALAILLPQIQSSTSAIAVESAFGVNPYLTGGIYALLLGFVILGGVKRIAKTSQVIVPFMAFGYIAITLTVLAVNYDAIPSVLQLIFSSAFGLDSTFGGIIGSAIAWGVKRGIYSNEAGMGTAAHHAGAAEVSHPVKQGLIQAFSVYIDTLLVCSGTAFLVLSTGMYNIFAKDGSYLVNHVPDVKMGPAYAQSAIDSVYPGFGSAFLAISLLFFTFTSVIAFFYIAETNLAFLIRDQKFSLGNKILKVVIIVSTFYGATISTSEAWAIGDVGMGLIIWINFIAILILAKPAVIALKDYESQRKQGLNPVFHPSKLGIKNADCWSEATAKPNDKVPSAAVELLN
ncbi:alanine/glycine:cation symporter family protein [Celerinatantimonas sp. YJH-8]|uniref:alanine/glycine:cation symporter family protein n=1 Tax=Celerinatantimonas sp. YJH-8 TaxID=3228714 RepID=UPI0038BFBFE6